MIVLPRHEDTILAVTGLKNVLMLALIVPVLIAFASMLSELIGCSSVLQRKKL